MKRLNNFEIYNPHQHKNIFVSVMNYGVTFSTGTVDALDRPAAVYVYFDSKNKRIALKASPAGDWKFVRKGKTGDKSKDNNNYKTRSNNKTDSKAHDKTSNNNGGNKNGYVRWNHARLKDKIANVAGCQVTDIMGKRFEGTYYDDENAVIFDLMKQKPVRKKRS